MYPYVTGMMNGFIQGVGCIRYDIDFKCYNALIINWSHEFQPLLLVINASATSRVANIV